MEELTPCIRDSALGIGVTRTEIIRIAKRVRNLSLVSINLLTAYDRLTYGIAIRGHQYMNVDFGEVPSVKPVLEAVAA